MTTASPDMEQDQPQDTILGHLNELRIRLTWVAGGIMITTIGGFFLAEPTLLYLLVPYGRELQVLSPTEVIEVFFLVAFIIGAVLSMPNTMYQLWLFISPALEKREKRYVFIFLPTVILLFLTGLAFAWFILVPAAVNFLSTFQSGIFEADWQSREYLTFIMLMLFWLGVSFEMPVVFYFIGRFNILEWRSLLSQWRYAIVGTSIMAAAITPSIDPVTMLLTMAPLLVLYYVSIGTTWLGQRHFEKAVAY